MRLIKMSGNRYMIEGSQKVYSEEEINRMRAEIDITTDGCVKELYEEKVEVEDESIVESVADEIENIEEATADVEPAKKPRRK